MGNPEITMIEHLDLSDVEQGLDRLQEKVNRLNAALAEAKRTADTLENETVDEIMHRLQEKLHRNEPVFLP